MLSTKIASLILLFAVSASSAAQSGVSSYRRFEDWQGNVRGSHATCSLRLFYGEYDQLLAASALSENRREIFNLDLASLNDETILRGSQTHFWGVEIKMRLDIWRDEFGLPSKYYYYQTTAFTEDRPDMVNEQTCINLKLSSPPR